eukprot:1337972-Pyramimonas_sp.AAC.1
MSILGAKRRRIGDRDADADMGDAPEPGDKRGIGFMGVLLAQLMTLSAAIRKKACKFCGRKVTDPDELNEGCTLSWAKPDYAGKVCALCGATKNRLRPRKSSAEVLRDVQTDEKDRKEFMDFRAWLCGQYMARA